MIPTPVLAIPHFPIRSTHPVRPIWRKGLAALSLILLAGLPAGSAAPITWTAPVGIAADTDVSTEGAGVWAFCYNASTPILLNGVSFTAETVGSITWTSSAAPYANTTPNFAGASPLSAAFKQVLYGATYTSGAPVTLTLNNLAVGHQYRIQLWANDSRAQYNRSQTLTSPGGNTVTQQFNTGTGAGGLGQSASGLFTANATTQQFTVGGNAVSQVNAIQLRDLSIMTSPVFAPVAGTYAGTQTVTLTAEAGSTIHFTTDGTTPNNTSPSGAAGSGTASANVPDSLTLKAYATKAGKADSAVVTADYVITPASPSFNPPPGNYLGNQTVTLTAEPGTTIHYTTDGTSPGAESPHGPTGAGSATVTVTAPGCVSICAIAIKPGKPDSSPATGTYLAVSEAAGAAGFADLRYTAALDAATIRQTSLSSPSDNNMLLGNGDINALLYGGSSGLKLRLTKNDVWDARLDTSGDPVLPVVNIAAHSWTGSAGDPPSWSRSYPCPLACAVLDLTSAAVGKAWQNIRAQGTTNTWTYANGLATMAIQGNAGVSCGWQTPITTGRTYTSVRVRLSGTANAKHYVEVLKSGGGNYGSSWQITPTTEQDYEFTLPAATGVAGIILYAWTTDGGLAKNQYSAVELRGAGGNDTLDLSRVNPVPATTALDLRRATATVPGTTSSTVSVRALADRNVFLIEGDTTVTLNPTSAGFVPAATRGTQGGVEYLLQTLPADPGYPATGDWPGMSFAVAKAAQGQRTAVAIVTSMESANPQAAAIALVSDAIAADANTLRQTHESLWEQFWDACRVDLGDSYLRDVWYRNLYFMRCVSKAGVKPAGLFASLLNDSPDWHGDYHLNYNMQQTFWGWYGCNHAELSDPYESFINDYIPRAQWLSNTTYGCGGAFFPHSVFLYEPSNPVACKSKNGRQMVFIPYTYTIGDSGWAVHNHWLHYKHYPDQALLQNQVYPSIKQVAIFYADFADKCATNATTGKVTFGPTYSPEHWTLGKDDGTTDIAFARMTLKAAIEGATNLGVDAALVTRWQGTLAKIPDYPRTTGASPVIVDVAGVSPTTYNVPIPALPVYPAGEIHWFSTAADRQIFTNTISSMSSNGNNDMIILAGARARLGMADAYSWMRSQFQARQRPNGQLKLSSGYPTYAPFTEDFAATAAINELLLQSVNDILRVFPAWPADKEAAFENLRAQGGFLVSGEFRNGATTTCTIRSTVGGRLRFLNPWPAMPVLRVNGVPTAPTDEGGGIFGLDTAADDQITLAATPFTAWQGFHFGSPADPYADPAADPDGDGVENGIEFLTGSIPTDHSSRNSPTFQRDSDSGDVVVHFFRVDAAETYAVNIEYSTDLTEWSSIPVPAGGVSGPPVVVVDHGSDADEITAVIPPVTDPKKFARVKIVVP